MVNILDKIKIKDLKEDDYIVVLPKELLDRGYNECADIIKALERRFPQKTFLGLPENIEFKRYKTEELLEVIKFIQEEIDSRNE